MKQNYFNFSVKNAEMLQNVIFFRFPNFKTETYKKMEVDSTEWDAICRICLQEGTLHSLFDYDDEKSEMNIAEKIMLCSPIEVNWRFSIFFSLDFREI